MIYLKRLKRKATKLERKNGGVIISYLRNNFNSIKSINIPCPIENLPRYRLTVDEDVDLKLIRKIYKYFSPNIHFGFSEIIKFAKKKQKAF